MNTRMDKIFGDTRRRRRARLIATLAGVVVVPLAIAGLVAGALGDAGDRVDRIPAIVVNNDKMITTTAADGAKQYVLAGRELVTELTGHRQGGLSWTISNSAQAEKALSDGSTYAVLTIPAGFSESISSLSGASPRQAKLSITTDQAHDYLATTVAQSVGGAMADAFGRAITTRYIASAFSGLEQTGGALRTAAGSASQLAAGATSLASGLDALQTGVSSAASGASQLSQGVSSYTSGVQQLSGGLTQLDGGLPSLTGAVGSYTDGVSSLAASLSSAVAGLSSPDPAVVAQSQAEVAAISQKLSGLDSAGSSLRAASAQVQTGAAQLSAAAQRLAAASPGLRDGASGLAAGLPALQSGAGSSASGAQQLASGTSQLAEGLSEGATKSAALGKGSAEKTAKVIADPVAVQVGKDNEISSFGAALAMVFVPIGLWLGALAIFLIIRPASALALASTASTARIVYHGFSRAAALALAQAAVLTVLLHTALGVKWSLLPETAGFAVLLALSFAAIHYLLTALFGRIGVIVSLVLLALQLASTGGVFPVQLLSAPFQAIGSVLPMTYAIHGMQALVAGAGPAAVLTPAVVLALIGAVSVLIAAVVIARRRGSRALGPALAWA